MTFHVTLQPSGHSFEADPARNILRSGLEAGFSLPYSCRASGCATCKARIVSGAVDHGASSEAYLPQSMRDQGMALLCQAKPLSDLVIEVKELTLHLAKPKVIPCRVRRMQRLSPDVMLLQLRTPYNENMLFAAGQYIDLLFDNGRRRSYSIALPPMLTGGMMDLELHIRHSAGGVFTDRVFSNMTPGEMLRFEGPLGTFYLREDSTKPIVLLASGTGFGPIKAMIEYALSRKMLETRPMALYWGARSKQDLYMLDAPQRWTREAPNFTFVPVLSDPLATDAWVGRTGFVHHAVMEDFPDLAGHQVYAWGAPVTVDAARRDFTSRCGLPTHEFFADSFLTEAELAHNAPSS
jgi:CDP-4-dehydro-6-deoxyglucose reductase, E3